MWKDYNASYSWGFEKPDDGRVLHGDKDIVDTPPYKRNINTVFQRYALFPLAYPSKEILNNCEVFVDLGLEMTEYYNEKWNELKASLN
jgi:ABC-type thiamine transport system ATPase subunit